MYHLIVDLLRPPVLVYLVVGVALALLWRKRPQTRRRLVVVTAAFVLLTLLCLPVTGYLALRTLEGPYPPLERRPDDAGAIVVLSGSMQLLDGQGVRVELGTDTLYRCLRAAELYREAPCPVVVSGGKVHDSDPGPTLAEAMHKFLVRQGVAAKHLIVEDRSHNTHENAVECSRLLAERGISRVVLVTDATHLIRAEGCFRQQGLDVVPCGCRYRTGRWRGAVADFVPSPSAAAGFETAWHEWLGIAWYRLRGRM
jgi:uncharacterized SAM-binding protein YcdF (DUF218 family)